jgi:hypothetical protein
MAAAIAVVIASSSSRFKTRKSVLIAVL